MAAGSTMGGTMVVMEDLGAVAVGLLVAMEAGSLARDQPSG